MICWHDLLAPGEALHAILTQASGYAPVDLAQLERLFRENAYVSADTASVPPPFGASQTGFAFRSSTGNEELPTLGLWTRITTNDALEFLERTAARAMSELHGVQALVTRWGRVPFMSLDRTPYEEVCPELRGERLTRANLSRFVRAVAPGDLWLGSKLARHVDTTWLACLAEVKAHGDSVHVVVPDDSARIRAIEEALRPILPGSS